MAVQAQSSRLAASFARWTCLVLFALFGTLARGREHSAEPGLGLAGGRAPLSGPRWSPIRKTTPPRFEYDALGRRTAGFLPDDSVERVEYEAVNEAAGASIQVPKKTVTDFNGRQTTVFHDRMDRLVTNRFPAITRWDEVTGLLTDYRAVTNTYEYTATGRRARVVQSAAVNRAECYVYDTLGNLRVRWTPECVISYTPDNFGAITRISARSVYNAWPATMSADGYVYDTVFAAGREERNPNGAEWTYHHDARGRLDAVNPDATSADAAYTYDADGNRVSKTAGGVTTLYPGRQPKPQRLRASDRRPPGSIGRSHGHIRLRPGPREPETRRRGQVLRHRRASAGEVLMRGSYLKSLRLKSNNEFSLSPSKTAQPQSPKCRS